MSSSEKHSTWLAMATLYSVPKTSIFWHLRDVLKESVNDQYDYIDWWLYEATDDYTVWEADCTMKYCLKEPEALYDFITGTLKPVPVSSEDSTSQQE